MEKKQSSIEWLEWQINLGLSERGLISAFKEAKAIHRKEILEARQNGLDNGFTNGCWDSNLYYEEEFGGENE